MYDTIPTNSTHVKEIIITFFPVFGIETSAVVLSFFSILFTFIDTFLLFPAKSYIVTSSSLFCEAVTSIRIIYIYSIKCF